MLFRSLALLPLAIGGIAAEAVNYDGHQAFRVMTDGDAASVSKKLDQIGANRWSMGMKDHIDVSVSGDKIEEFKKMGLRFKEMHKDLGHDIRKEKEWKPYRGKHGKGRGKGRGKGWGWGRQDDLPPDSWFDTYHPYEDHQEFWKDLQSALPKQIEMISSGTSYEGRDLFGIKLSGSKQVKDKQAIIWHGNVHAREWITSMTLVDKVAEKMPIKFYADWHSYGQYMLSPYGFSCDMYPANSMEQVDLAGEVAQVIESVHGTNFTYGPICQTLYSVGGGSTDYVYDVAGAEYSYAFELRDQGDFGFVLPPNQIRPTGEEMWAGTKYLLLNM